MSSPYKPGPGPYNNPQITIANPLAPRGQQLTNFYALINSQPNVVGVMVFRNGLLQTEGLDFTRNGGILTMAVPPQPGDLMVAQVYTLGLQLGGSNPVRYVSPIALQITGKFDGVSTLAEIVFGPTIMGGVDGKNNLFTFGVSFQRVQVWRNGLLQTWAQDYAAGPTAIVFYPASIPQPGDIITLLGFNNC